LSRVKDKKAVTTKKFVRQTDFGGYIYRYTPVATPLDVFTIHSWTEHV